MRSMIRSISCARCFRPMQTLPLNTVFVYRGAFLYVRPESHEKPTPVNPEEDRFFSLFRNTVSAAQQHKLIRSGDPDVMAQILWSGLHGAIALPLNLDRLALEPPEQATEHMIDALLEWLKP